MANPLSPVRGTTRQILYPFTRTIEFVTRVNVAANQAEQRYLVRGPLTMLSLPYSELLKADETAQELWFRNARGMFDKTITVTLDTVTYGDLALQQDTFQTTIKQKFFYDTQILLKQEKNPSWVPSPAPSAYPLFSVGARAQYPYTRVLRFATIVNDMETGNRYSLSTIGGPFSNFPTDALHSWEIQYPLLTDVDLAVLEPFFMACMGRYRHFAFTDPDTGIVYPNCRLDQDALAIRYISARPGNAGGHLVSTSVKLTEFFVP